MTDPVREEMKEKMGWDRLAEETQPTVEARITDLLRVIRGHGSMQPESSMGCWIADADLTRTFDSLPEEVKSGKSE